MDSTWLGTAWKLLVARGVLAVVFGIMAIAWPLSTALALVTLWGIWALLDGISSISQAVARPNPTVVKLALGLLGAVAVLAGLFAIFHPVSAGLTLAWVLGIWLIARAAMEAVLAFSGASAAPRGMLLLSAALDLLLGILFVANPGRSALGITTFLGILALIWGAVFIGVGLAARRESTDAGAAAPAV
ncbi:MAG: DUF308 domain-containing protein [Nocardioidaceae bacterium]